MYEVKEMLASTGESKGGESGELMVLLERGSRCKDFRRGEALSCREG